MLAGRHCGAGGEGKGKIMAMTSADGRVIARVNMQGAGSGHRVWGSSDGGRNWDRNDTVFPFSIASFVQFGQANAGAPSDYIYALESASPGLKLLRVRPTSVQNPTAYEYFSGTPTAPTWSSTRTNAKSIFTDPAGVSRPSITYVPSLNRYLLAVAHAPGLDSSGHRVGIFEAPAMYGPWRTVSYVDNFLGIRGGEFLGINFPRKWHAQDGRTLWAVFPVIT